MSGTRTFRRGPEVFETPQDKAIFAKARFSNREFDFPSGGQWEHAMSNSTNASLGSVTGRDEFIIGEALATALIALEQLPEVRQPTRNMADMKMLLNSLYAPPEVSLHLTTARWRFIPCARPFGARDVERGDR
jgi:hypothetical protein